MHICHTQAISGLEGSPSRDFNKLRASRSLKQSEHFSDLSYDGSEEISSQIQRQFIQEIELAEELANSINPGMLFFFSLKEKKKKTTSALFLWYSRNMLKVFIYIGNTQLPDAMETIFQAALDLGKLGGVSFFCPFTKESDERSKTKISVTVCSFSYTQFH